MDIGSSYEESFCLNTLGKRSVARLIAVIDYKAGNLTSVVKALHYLGAETTVTQDPDVVRGASRIVLPGVGHFRSTALLEELGVTEAVRDAVGQGSLFLGVCVGLQWLFEGSTEAPGTAGLGYFPGMCERFPAAYEGAELKSPHVGWNSLDEVRAGVKAVAGHRAGRVCVLHALVAGAGGGGNGLRDALWRGVYGCGRAGERDGCAVSSGEVQQRGATGTEELCGDVRMPFVYDLTLAEGEPEFTFVQQLVAVGTLVGTGQAVATVTDGAMEFHVPAPRQGLLVEWFVEHGGRVAGGDGLARVVCDGERVDVPGATAMRLG